VLKGRAIFVGTLFSVLTLAVAACSSGNAVVPSSSSANAAGAVAPELRSDAGIPGKGANDVSAHYVVFKQTWDKPTIVVISIQAADDYLKAFPGSTRLAGAMILYPDGSKQVTDAQGEFDAGMSSYAQAHPEKINGTDIAVFIEAPAAESLKPIQTTIFAPSESEEKKIDSGVIPPGTKPVDSPRPPSVVRSASAPTCNWWNYGEFKEVYPLQMYALELSTGKGAWYAPHFDTCGANQPSDAVKWWSLGWRDSLGSDVWTVDVEFKPGYGGQYIGLWWSPSHYFFHQDIRQSVLSLMNDAQP
jgi:hypothetical protein